MAIASGETGPNCPTPGAGSCRPTDDDDETTPLIPDADLAILKSTQTIPAAPNSTVRWDLAVVNNGPGRAVNVVITDVVPSAVTVTGVSSTAFQCSRDGNRVTCVVASLAPGASGLVSIESRVPANAPAGSISNVASVGSDTPDPNPTNNEDDARVTVEIPPVVQPPTPERNNPLPRTGSDLTLLVLRAAGMLVVAGLGMRLVTRRRRSIDDSARPT